MVDKPGLGEHMILLWEENMNWRVRVKGEKSLQQNFSQKIGAFSRGHLYNLGHRWNSIWSFFFMLMNLDSRTAQQMGKPYKDFKIPS